MTHSPFDLADLARRVDHSRTQALGRFCSGATDGPTTASILSRTLDRFFQRALRPWSERECGFAVLALGSYGRFALSLHSDVDCLVLYRSSEPKGAIEAMSAAVRALWDVGIRARVAVYSPARARGLAGRDERVLASLLDHRLVLGSPAMIEELERALVQMPDNHVRGLARLILQEDEAKTGTRHQDLFAAEPDLKTGQGGLRDLAALGWFWKWARLRTPNERDPDSRHRLLADPGVQAVLKEVSRRASILRRSRAILGTARLLLDAAGLPGDRFTREAASVLERQGVPAYRPIEFERDMSWVRIQVHGLLRPLIESVIRGHGWRRRLVFKQGSPPKTTLAHSRLSRLLPDPVEYGGTTPVPREDPLEVQALLQMLMQPHPRSTLDKLHRLGILFRLVPGFHRTLGVVPGDEVHAFTLDRHLVLVAATVADILDEVAPVPSGTNAAIPAGRHHRGPLMLAALLHDLGKTTLGSPKPTRFPFGTRAPVHPEAGANLARVATLKMGVPREQADLVAFLCRHHMVLPDASTTLDCESPEILGRLDRVFPDIERLDLAFLLSLADMRSLGPDTATRFREALLARAWSALRRFKNQKDGAAGWEAEVESRRGHLAERCALEHRGDPLLALIRSLPDRLLMAFETDRLWDLLLRLDEVRRRGPMVLVESVGSDPEGPRSDHEIIYLGHDEIGLLSRLSGGLTLAGLSIEEARIFSIGPIPSTPTDIPSPPLVLDQFRVTDPGGVIAETPESRRALADRILAAVSDPSVPRRVQGRIREALRARDSEMLAEVDNSSLPDRTVFRVAGPDTLGLLHMLADIFFRHGINVSGAIVTTEAGTARDTFFAEWAASGEKVLDAEVIRKVLRAISRIGRAA